MANSTHTPLFPGRPTAPTPATAHKGRAPRREKLENPSPVRESARVEGRHSKIPVDDIDRPRVSKLGALLASDFTHPHTFYHRTRNPGTNHPLSWHMYILY
jgi:hypothetical protein